MTTHLLIFGLGYSGAAVARAALAAGLRVSAASRDPAALRPPHGVALQPFAAPLPDDITHILATAPPGESDPVLATHAAAIAAAPALRWIGYLSTTGVYGDRAGAWVDETTEPAPASPRARRRLAAEQEWTALSNRVAVDLFRVAGIYGPGRSAFDEVAAGRARRVLRPGHCFGRIHRDDIAGAVLAAIQQTPPPGRRVLHLSDDLPAEPAAVVEEAARLLGLEPPPAIPFAEAELSPMARSFWSENRKVASAITQQRLGYRWRYPTYRAGLAAILGQPVLEQQRGDHPGQQGEVPRP